MVTAITPKIDIREATRLEAEPVYGTDVGVGVVLELADEPVPPTRAKLAQVIMVLFA